MNKTELLKRVADHLSISHKDMLYIINAWEDMFTEAIKEEGFVVMKGFGSFTLWQQSARPGRNPKTGKPALISARNSLKFKPGKDLLLKLNEGVDGNLHKE